MADVLPDPLLTMLERLKLTALRDRIDNLLDEAGRRLAPDWVARYLRNPHAVKPATPMPAMCAAERSGAASERARNERRDISKTPT